MVTDEYEKKRDFEKTPEPRGKKPVVSADKLQFVVHRHQASHLHWDLRLEMDGVLKSWAVPKEPPLEPGIRRLGVQVEDHPMDYKDFEGTIPEGEYGAGTVEIWDNGNYQLQVREPDKIEFVLGGKKMNGPYVLVHTRGKNWILLKRKGR
ncbi:MAG: 3'-phosphoesterase [Chloroflexi bacterium]|nr:3'-phosphoesterase [Chloroflexota bacterium]